MTYKILMVDDELLALETARVNLAGRADIEFVATTSAIEALKIIKSNPRTFAAIIVDYQMPEKDGATLTKEILAVNPKALVLIHSGDYTREALKRSYDAGASDFIEKNCSPELFCAKVADVCKKWEDTVATFDNPDDNDNSELIAQIKMKGRSAALGELSRTVQLAAPTNCTILIQGESGTGKELIARAIHEKSERRLRPFVAINVAAIPDALIESDLFGHEKGAFTGADRNKIGKLKLADTGTVFLDEIGDLKPELQVKLLRFLQEGEIHSVGSNATTKVNVRVIAASHVNLEEAVAKGKFREDLYYRLNVIRLFIPPLRSRPEDIQPLIAHFQKQFGGAKKSLLMKTIRYMERYPWPGNVRELENEMERLMAIIPSDHIEPTHLSAKFFKETSPLSATSLHDLPYDKFLEQQASQEREYILANISKGGSLREAAKHWMRAPYTTIYGRMKKLNILNVINGGENNEKEAIL